MDYVRSRCSRRCSAPTSTGDHDYFLNDPHWRDLVRFCEYFDGDDGHGCGAMHQTGWTATVTILLQLKGRFRATRVATRENSQRLAKQ